MTDNQYYIDKLIEYVQGIDRRVAGLEEKVKRREMQAIYKERVDAHDKGLEYAGNRLAAIEATLETVATDLKLLTTNVNQLVAALLREHSNGKHDS